MMYFALDNDLAAGGKLTFEFADSGFTPTAGNVWDLSEATDLDAPEDDDDFCGTSDATSEGDGYWF
jgi:hypothetical protein